MKFTSSLLVASFLASGSESFVWSSHSARPATQRAVLSVDQTEASLIPPVSLKDFMKQEGATAKSYEEHVQKTYG